VSNVDDAFAIINDYYQGDVMKDENGNEMKMPDGTPIKDWSSAIKQAQSQIVANVSTAFSLYFGPSEYYFSDSIELIRPMSLIGSGGSGYVPGTKLKFPPGKHGIISYFPNNAPRDPGKRRLTDP
jgi:hypothetical protein